MLPCDVGEAQGIDEAQPEVAAKRASGRYLAYLIRRALNAADAGAAAGAGAGAGADDDAATADAAIDGAAIDGAATAQASTPLEPAAAATWERVHALAAFNSVEGISWLGARDCATVPPELRLRWENEANQTFFRRVSFDEEREHVLAAMDERGLAHLPLKGSVLASYYPAPEMRSMADNDILYGFVEPDASGTGFCVRGTTPAERARTVASAMDEMSRIMRARGYKVASQKVGNHESYHKEPIFNFEMHRRLMSPDSPFVEYYENPWSRARQSADNPLAFSFSNEDEYVYLLAHAFKHFDVSGCGVRFVVDVQVFLREKGAQMDWAYVREQLEELGLSEFEARVKALSEHAFGRGSADSVCGAGSDAGEGSAAPDGMALTAEDERLLYYLLGCGTYGNMRVRVEQEVRRLSGDSDSAADDGAAGMRSAKQRYVWGRVFLDEKTMESAYPFFYQHKVLRPVLPIYRAVRGLIVHPTQLLREFKILSRLGKRERK